MKVKSLISLLLCTAPILSYAHNLTTEKALPPVTVENHGELILENNEIVYNTWSDAKLKGKTRVIQAIAGRSSAKKLNTELMQAITAAKFPEERYQTTSIINQDDSIWGTGSFVKSSAQDSKKEFPWSSMVLDEDGKVASTWELAEESSAIIVLDRTGLIKFVKEGALNSEEIQHVISLIQANL